MTGLLQDAKHALIWPWEEKSSSTQTNHSLWGKINVLWVSNFHNSNYYCCDGIP